MQKRLPDAEFNVMKAVWKSIPPMSVNTVASQMDNDWKIQSVISLMRRLVDRGFLRTEKNGKERVYYPLITRDDYLKTETGHFIKRYHANSFLDLVTALYDSEALTEKDIDDLLSWANGRRRK
jgi:predicted transcriptional regulator